jgi:hypothetical protein
MKYILLHLLGLSALILCARVASADDQYQINIQTSALLGLTDQFALDLQLIDGSGLGDGNNTATLSNFNFGSGSWIGLDPGNVVLHDSTFFSEFTQAFNPGTSLSFTLDVTNAVDAGDTPDELSLAILDNTTGGFEIPTTGPGDALLTVNFNGNIPAIATFPSDLSRTTINIPAPAVVAVPESTTISLVAVGMGLLGIMTLIPTAQSFFWRL